MTAAVQLMAHQEEGITFLVGKRAGLLAFEQGLGKTLVAIEAFQRVRKEGSASRLLVICPNSLKRNWASELARFAPDLEATIIEGPPRRRRQALDESSTPVLIISYETARAEITTILAVLERRPTALVLDESHATKTWRSLTSVAARHLAPHCPYRWLLSGTPVTNSPADIYTQVEIMAPGENRLGSQESFLATALARPQVARDKVAPLVLRRTKEECLDLPDKTFVDVRVELPAWQRKLYDGMRDQMVCAVKAMSGDEYRAFASTALAQLTRLMQIASNPRMILPDLAETPGKVEELDAIIEDILAVSGRKVIIWSSYVATIEMLLQRYEAHGAVAIYGGTPADERQGVATRFQADPACRVLIGNPAAAGSGFTLTAATFTIYESLGWRYDFYAQSQDRNHRIGQGLPVTYLRLIAADTIEEAIILALERKTKMAGNLLGDPNGPPAVADLTRDQMLALIQNNKLPHA